MNTDGVPDALEVLTGKTTVKLPGSDKEVLIRKATLRTTKAITALLADVMEGLSADEVVANGLGSPSDILRMLSTHYDQTVSVAALLTDLTLDELLDLELDASLTVIEAVVSVNKVFFMEKILPLVNALLDRVNGKEAVAG